MVDVVVAIPDNSRRLTHLAEEVYGITADGQEYCIKHRYPSRVHQWTDHRGLSFQKIRFRLRQEVYVKQVIAAELEGRPV